MYEYTSSTGLLGMEVSSPTSNLAFGLIGIGPNHLTSSKL